MSSKSRFDGLDCKAMAAHMQTQLTGRRVVNIYDGENGETYIFKLDGDASTAAAAASSSSGGGGAGSDGSKSFLLMESGLRFHPVSNFQAETSRMPSPFCAKLRKHLRGLRLEHVQQLGKCDRVVLFQWGVGPSRHTIILELYAKGNIILTDKDFVVLSLLRSHLYQAESSTVGIEADEPSKSIEGNAQSSTRKNKEDKKDNNAVAVQVGQVFPVSYATTMETIATEETGGSMEENASTEATATAVELPTAAAFNDWAAQHIRKAAAASSSQKGSTSKKKSKTKTSCTPKTLLLLNSDSGVSHFGPGLIEHCIRVADGDPNLNLVQRLEQLDQTPEVPPNGSPDVAPRAPCIWSDEAWALLRDALQLEGTRILDSLDGVHNSEGQPGGFILFKPQSDNDNSDTAVESVLAVSPDRLPHADKLLLEFQPILLRQHEHRPVLTYDTFADAVQDFFRHLQHQKNWIKAQSAEQAAATRLEKIRADQKERVRQLERQQVVHEQQATAVQQHATSVDRALQVVNSALGSGMDWDQLEQVVRVEQMQNRNPIALLIHKLELEEDAMVLRLPTLTTDLAQYFDSSHAPEPTLDVRVSLNESAFGNANALFAKYRSSKEKSQKTMEASTKALKAAEETARKQLADAKKRQHAAMNSGTAAGRRKALWFEKFHWFVTSDNYLAIAGRDAHQNELLVKRYLRPGDAYLHADVHGAASVILRAKRRRRGTKEGGTEVLPLSEQALREAGNFTICRSSAWSSRMITSAWWVEAHQVSKTAPTGEYLTVGSFMIRGKKQFLPPSPLEMGMGVLFLLGDDDSIRRHSNERRDLALLALDDDGDAAISVDDEKVNEMEKDSISANGQAPSATTQRGEQSNRRKPTNREDNIGRDDNIDKSFNDDNSHAEPNNNTDVGNANADSGRHDDIESVVNEEEPTEENKGHNNYNDDTKSKKKKGLSARDRRLIKKYGSLETAEKAHTARDEEPTDESRIATETATSDAPMLVKRGRKARQKKIMTKYADQDDEDRELAMQALQGGEKVKKTKTQGSKRRDIKVSEKQQQVAAETVALLTKDSSSIAKTLTDEVRQPLAECVTVRNSVNNSNEKDATVRWDKLDAEIIEQLLGLEPVEAQVAAANRLLELKKSTRVDNFSASLGGIIRTIRKHGYKELGQVANGDKANVQNSKQNEDNEVLQWKQTMEPEGVNDDDDVNADEDAVDDTTELNKLTGKPQPEDVILCAVPICAPYQTLSQFAYRVKLTPGNMKRGKASKQCVDMLLKSPANKGSDGADRQLDLIKRVGDNDWVQVICGDVKIASAGVSKVVKRNKAQSKQKIKNGK